MRFLLKVNIPVESGNAAAKAGKLGATIQSILADLKPEAVYFTDNNGQRTAFIVFDMQDASQIPAIAEPWFLAFNASVEIHPVTGNNRVRSIIIAQSDHRLSHRAGCAPSLHCPAHNRPTVVKWTPNSFAIS